MLPVRGCLEEKGHRARSEFTVSESVFLPLAALSGDGTLSGAIFASQSERAINRLDWGELIT